jgi:hypothetical protein
MAGAHASRVLAFLRERQRCGDDGKTLLMGWRAQAPEFAVAAGLRGDEDHPGFLAFARYLIHHRFRSDGFALLLPAILDDVPVYVAEWRLGGDSALVTIGPEGELLPNDLHRGLLGDLGDAGPPLPGLMRRELDRLYELLKVPPVQVDPG